MLPRHPPCALSAFLSITSFYFLSFYLLFISHCPILTLLLIVQGTIKIKEEAANFFLLRKEVIHPHLPVRIPCYDFTPIAYHTFSASSLTVRPAISGATNSRGVTGGVYKTRERIHRGIADPRLLAIPTS